MSAGSFDTSGCLPLSLAAATAMHPDEIGDLSVSDLYLSDSDRDRAARVWLWLCGVADDSAVADRVRREVLTDGGLIVALNLPASEFLRWFRAVQWIEFDSTERTPSDAWAMGVMQRAWAVCETLGQKAKQVSLASRPSALTSAK